MFSLSSRSLKNLEGVHPKLVACVKTAIELTEQDFTVVEGLRTLEKQREYFNKGASKTMKSKHLKQPDGYGHAVDLYPYYDGKVQVNAPLIKFEDIKVAMFKAAAIHGCSLTWGADWDGDGDIHEHSFIDSPHFQLNV